MLPFTTLSSRSHYGLVFLSFLAHRATKQSAAVSTNFVAKHTGISQGYLEEIARALRNRGLISASRGAKGGYRLTKPVKDVRLQDVLEATEGPFMLVSCLGEKGTCSIKKGFEHGCVSRKVLGRMQRGVAGALRNIRLSEFMK